MSRVYLDWNATAPLRPEARAAMIAAMDVVGNPSSVHAEGRATKGIIEKARGQVAALVGCEPSEIVFTSGATEAASYALNGAFGYCSQAEHDAVLTNCRKSEALKVNQTGQIAFDDIPNIPFYDNTSNEFFCAQIANSETGVIHDLADFSVKCVEASFENVLADAAQACGKIDLKKYLSNLKITPRVPISAHKIGGPKGIGGLTCVRESFQPSLKPMIKGGGQEMGRRSGTENVIGIAGFGAAAEAAQRDLENGVWENVEKLRDQLEDRIMAEAPDLIIFGKDAPRLPNTSNFGIPGWKGETQVMQLDLAGFAVSAGSACSSGKVKTSRVLKAMGYDDNTASSAIRVSIGPTTSEADLMAFADTWIEHYRRFKAKAA